MLNWKLIWWNIQLLNLYSVHVSNDDDNDIITLMFSDIDTVNESTTCDEFNYNYNF